MTQAAEYVYSHAEPVRWAYYLTNSGRDQEAVDFSRNMFATADKPVRPFLLHTWGNAARDLGDLKQSVRLDRAAIQLKPDYWDAHHNLQLALADLGDEEGAWRAGEEMRHVAGVRPGKVPEDDYLIYDTVTWNLNASLQYIVHDADATGGVGTRTTGVGLLIADLQINLHDVKAAELTLQTVKPDPTDKEIAVMSHFEKGRLGMETGDVGLAANEMDAFISKFTDPAVINDNFGAACYAAPAAEAAGRRDRADEILRTAGRFVDCYRFRGDILDNRNDWTGAQKAYAEAVALAPDLPAPYYSWGMALARHHDLIGSLAKLQAAHHRGPGWADPLKSMGDVLVQQGNRPAALAKYDEAIRLAPAWNQLRLARESIVHR
jgi:tetratricopeptide (TPR) repeat protein